MTIAIIGGDKRYEYVYSLLCDKGYDVITYNLFKEQDSNSTFEEVIAKGDFILLPIPFKVPNNFYEYLSNSQTILSGYIPPKSKEFFKEREISNYDFATNTIFLKQNSIATSEGAIMYAMQSPYTTINLSQSLVMGYGKCGSEIAKRLKFLGSKVFVFEKDVQKLNYAKLEGLNVISDLDAQFISVFSTSDYVFNTIPDTLINNPTLSLLPMSSCIIDIASGNCFDYDFAKANNINITKTGSIPPLIAPFTLANCITNIICSIINQRGE